MLYLLLTDIYTNTKKPSLGVQKVFFVFSVKIVFFLF